MDNLDITMEEYVQYEIEKALRNNQVYNWKLLRYESEKKIDYEDADGTNHSDLKLVKRSITRLYKFRKKNGNLRYFDVDLKVKKLVMYSLGKLLRSFRMKLREKYILPNLNTPSKLNELPTKYSAIVKAEEWVEFIENKEIEADKETPRGIMWLKGRVNKDRNKGNANTTDANDSRN
uniref:Uncharacterized protein n=1 Tax=Tanacetum cinerariifolium TaxID=118510 RepID=A0A699HBC6_TANCI|nr:hypothetical protein [Tanacetum cinerariifolium]